MKKICILIVFLVVTFITLNILCIKKITHDEVIEDMPVTKDKSIEGTIVFMYDNYIKIITESDSIYKFEYPNDEYSVGDDIKITYEGEISSLKDLQDVNIISVQKTDIDLNYSKEAIEILNSMTIEEKIGQLLMVSLPSYNQLDMIKNYNVGGLLLFRRDVDYISKEGLINKINTYQSVSKIPLYIAIDEEGGTVTRLSWNYQIVSEPFLSPQELYNIGGFDKIKEDGINKIALLEELGININLAPVADLATNEYSYMYQRSFGKNKELTSTFIKTVLSTQSDTVSYALKHFPGYGDNVDTHSGIAIDNRSYESFLENDFIPFKAGIENNARAILVSHNIVTSIENKPASLSLNMHNILRDELCFNGIIITDDLSMRAITNYSIDRPYVEGVLAGNNVLIVSDYAAAYNEIYSSVLNNEISEVLIDRLVLKNIEFKLKTIYKKETN